MPKGNAGRLIARDLRNNQEKRRRKIKTKANVHKNQQEFLRMTTRKKKQSKFTIKDLKLDGSDSDSSVLEDEEGNKKESSKTYMEYKRLLKSPKFVLSLQPRYCDDCDLDSDTDSKRGLDFAGDEKIGLIST